MKISKVTSALGKAWFPGVVVTGLLAFLMFVSPLDAAFIIGAGSGGLTSFVLLVPVLIVGAMARRWWQPIVFLPIAAFVNRVAYLQPLEPKPFAFDLAMQLAAVLMGLVLVSIVSGLRDILNRKSQ